jgi:hypothetical protein
MASESPTPPREALEQQDLSIKARKHELFEKREPPSDHATIKPFSQYVRDTAPAPLSPAAKATIWGVGILVALLFLAALFGGRGPRPARARQASVTPAQGSVVA